MNAATAYTKGYDAARAANVVGAKYAPVSSARVAFIASFCAEYAEEYVAGWQASCDDLNVEVDEDGITVAPSGIVEGEAEGGEEWNYLVARAAAYRVNTRRAAGDLYATSR